MNPEHPDDLPPDSLDELDLLSEELRTIEEVRERHGSTAHIEVTPPSDGAGWRFTIGLPEPGDKALLEP